MNKRRKEPFFSKLFRRRRDRAKFKVTMLKDLILRIFNQFVYEYFENIDASQLQYTFSGNVSLTNLMLKPNICEMLGLPFRAIAGRCGSLNIRINWRNLGSKPIEVDINDVYLLVVPGSSIPYDADSEEALRFRLKLQFLDNIEAAQKEMSLDDSSAGPTYFGKLLLQMVRNVQVKVQSVHFRYEDGETHPGKSFATGVVFSSLSILTTNDNWVPQYISNDVPTVHKVFNLDGFGIYWDTDSMMISKMEKEKSSRLDILKETFRIADFNYVLGPISILTMLRLTSSPEKEEVPFTSPKIFLDTTMEELSIRVSSVQFQDMMYLAASWEFLLRREHYRKFRPHLKTYSGHYREWWKFAYACVLEDISRRRNNWRWKRMLQHRLDCKAYYKALIRRNILRHSSTASLKGEIEELEKRLDIVNILIIRKQVAFLLHRKDKEEAKLRQDQSWAEWLKSFVSPSLSAHKPITEELDSIASEQMTPEEKQVLLKAVEMTEFTKKVTIVAPDHYVDTHIDFLLKVLKIIIVKDSRHWNFRHDVALGQQQTVLDLQVTNCFVALQTKPEDRGMKFEIHIKNIEAFGGEAPTTDTDKDQTPTIIAPRKIPKDKNIITFLYETKMEDFLLTRHLRIAGQPLDFTYDAPTAQKLLTCFTLPETERFERLQSEAMMTFQNFTNESSNKFQQVMECDNIECNIRFDAPCIIIPQKTDSSGILHVLVVELGQVVVTSQAIKPRPDLSEFSDDEELILS